MPFPPGLFFSFEIRVSVLDPQSLLAHICNGPYASPLLLLLLLLLLLFALVP